MAVCRANVTSSASQSVASSRASHVLPHIRCPAQWHPHRRWAKHRRNVRAQAHPRPVCAAPCYAVQARAVSISEYPRNLGVAANPCYLSCREWLDCGRSCNCLLGLWQSARNLALSGRDTVCARQLVWRGTGWGQWQERWRRRWHKVVKVYYMLKKSNPFSFLTADILSANPSMASLCPLPRSRYRHPQRRHVSRAAVRANLSPRSAPWTALRQRIRRACAWMLRYKEPKGPYQKKKKNRNRSTVRHLVWKFFQFLKLNFLHSYLLSVTQFT